MRVKRIAPTWAALLLLGASPVPARASEGAVVVVGPAPARAGDAGPGAARWRARLAARAEAMGLTVVDDPAQAVAGPGGVTPTRLEALAEVQARLVQARREAASLQEPAALADLARARALVEAHADLPGAAAWLGEVYALTGVVAFQSGRAELAERSLTAAATLDAARGLRAAEAPPALVERAAALARATAARPVGAFEVRADAPGARVLLDDREVGRAPVTVRAPVGVHVLRVEAPGRLSYGRVVDLLEGRRLPVRVRLAPAPAVEHARELMAAAAATRFGAMRRALSALAAEGHPLSVWWVRAGSGARDRAVVVACDRDGCRGPVRLDGRAEPLPAGPARSEAQLTERIQRSRMWLSEPPEAPPPPPPWYGRWYTWAAVGTVAAATALSAGLLSRPEATTRRRTVVDPGDLGAGLVSP